MPALENVTRVLDRAASADVAVHRQRCVAVRNRNAACAKCAQACAGGCISIRDNELVVQPERCIGCGTCATACPTCALEARHPGDAQLEREVLAAARANDGVAVIACAQICQAAEGRFDPARVVGVECLGRVDESLLVRLAAAGCSQAVLVQGRCDACDYRVGLETAREVAATANTLLATWDAPLQVRLAERFPASVRAEAAAWSQSRRAFFFRAKDEARDAAAAVADVAAEEVLGQAAPAEPRYLHVMDDGTLPHFVPDRRERLLDALASLGEPADDLIETRLWGHVVIDAEKCSGCRMCAVFCPTGALLRCEGDRFGLDHFPGDCVKCRCCEDVCPEGALRLSDEVFAQDLLSGAVEHIPMTPPAHVPGDPHTTKYTFRTLLGSDAVFDR